MTQSAEPMRPERLRPQTLKEAPNQGEVRSIDERGGDGSAVAQF